MELTEKNLQIAKYVLIALGLFILYKLLNKFGLLGETKEEKKAKELENQLVNVDMTDKQLVKDIQKKYGGNFTKIKVHTPKELTGMSLQIIKAHGVFDDDEQTIYNVFKSLYSKYDLSKLVLIFKVTGKGDLFLWLKSFLDDNEMATIYDITKKLPNV